MKKAGCEVRTSCPRDVQRQNSRYSSLLKGSLPAKTGSVGTWKKLGCGSSGEIIGTMKNRDANRHPGIMRVMKVDSEFAGILVAVGFLVMGAVGLDIGRWFVLGALALGVAVALLLRFTRKSD